MGQVLHERLQALRTFECVGDVRGRGLLAGIEFVEDRNTGRPYPSAARFAESFAAVALELGLVVWSNAGQLEDGTGDLVMLAPPFVITEEQIDEMVAILGQAAKRTAARVGAHR
jgi:adenosylmethionine-8-amino-7-oxononanoate aminotransferase